MDDTIFSLSLKKITRLFTDIPWLDVSGTPGTVYNTTTSQNGYWKPKYCSSAAMNWPRGIRSAQATKQAVSCN